VYGSAVSCDTDRARLVHTDDCGDYVVFTTIPAGCVTIAGGGGGVVGEGCDPGKIDPVARLFYTRGP